jgi:hypothetical protein
VTHFHKLFSLLCYMKKNAIRFSIGHPGQLRVPQLVVPYMYIRSTSVKCIHSSNEVLCGGEKITTLWIFFFFYVKGPRSANSSLQEYRNFKRKGSPLIEICQPTKFISLAEAVCRFQTNTPDRFHSRPKTGKKLFV